MKQGRYEDYMRGGMISQWPRSFSCASVAGWAVLLLGFPGICLLWEIKMSCDDRPFVAYTFVRVGEHSEIDRHL